jgi:hypothetical protein
VKKTNTERIGDPLYEFYRASGGLVVLPNCWVGQRAISHPPKANDRLDQIATIVEIAFRPGLHPGRSDSLEKFLQQL